MRETKKDRDIYREIVERYVQTMFFVDRIVYNKYAILYCLLIVALYPPLSLFIIIETKNNDQRSLL
jgi:hypothetical protein